VVSALPNWVDVVIVLIVGAMAYRGFARGVVAEFLHAIGAVSITALTVNYAGLVSEWLRPWISFDPTVAACLVFWSVFLIFLLVIHVLIRRLADVIKWEPVHWLTQGAGMLLGAVRGVWWAGFITVVVASSGFVWLRKSVEERSQLGPRFVNLARATIEQVADRFPGASSQSQALVPPIKPGAKPVRTTQPVGGTL
jgi:uncharacterized membrane protein required for colicin V production